LFCDGGYLGLLINKHINFIKNHPKLNFVQALITFLPSNITYHMIFQKRFEIKIPPNEKVKLVLFSSVNFRMEHKSQTMMRTIDITKFGTF